MNFINLGPGDDHLWTQGTSRTRPTIVLAGPGNDDIGVKPGLLTRIDAGAGDDEVHVFSDVYNKHATINCGAGNDYLRAYKSPKHRNCERLKIRT